jgi:hypothetical protein
MFRVSLDDAPFSWQIYRLTHDAGHGPTGIPIPPKRAKRVPLWMCTRCHRGVYAQASLCWRCRKAERAKHKRQMAGKI